VKLIASGRASEIFDLGDGRVLRRFRAGGDPQQETLVMAHALRHGYPAPRVLELAEDGLVLDRIEGPTMLEALRRHPWELRRLALLLADLHHRLHSIDAPPDLLAIDSGDRLLHLDLHAANVILSPDGPFVIDWTNARQGLAALDVALTWLIAATSRGTPRTSIATMVLARFDRRELLTALPRAAERRLGDVHVSDRERQAVRQFVRQSLGKSRHLQSPWLVSSLANAIVVLGARHRTRRSHTRPPVRLILLGYGERLPETSAIGETTR
jgi:aminoglycoside phosphotransferase (APT) family kinase protein